MAVDGIAHREDDIAVSLIEVAVSTQGHQRQLHFLEGLAEYAAVHTPHSCLPHSPPLLSLAQVAEGPSSCLYRQAAAQDKTTALASGSTLWEYSGSKCSGVLPHSLPLVSSAVSWGGL